METTRLRIRSPRTNDLDAILAICNSEYVLKYNASPVLKREELLQRFTEGIEKDATYHLECKDSNEVIGAIFIQPDRLRHGVQSACIAYYLDEKYAGKGYMSEAINEVLAYLFNEKDIDVVSARAFANNMASVALLKKLHFVHEGTLRHGVCGYHDIIYDDMVFSILREEYIKR